MARTSNLGTLAIAV